MAYRPTCTLYMYQSSCRWITYEEQDDKNAVLLISLHETNRGCLRLWGAFDVEMDSVSSLHHNGEKKQKTAFSSTTRTSSAMLYRNTPIHKCVDVHVHVIHVHTNVMHIYIVHTVHNIHIHVH